MTSRIETGSELLPFSRPVSVLHSTDALGWSRTTARVYRTTPSIFEPVAWTEASVSVNLAGRGRLLTRGPNGAPIDIETAPGMVWLCPAGDHSVGAELKDDAVSSVAIGINAQSWARACEREFDLDPASAQLVCGVGIRDSTIELIGQTIARELAEPGGAGSLLVETFTRALEAYLLRRHITRGWSPQLKPASTRGALEGSRLRRALDLIETRFDDDLSLEQLSREVGLSPFHFARAFKAETGSAPHQYLLELRFARAKDALANTRRAVADIALACGFKSASHFSSAFRRRFGVPPLAFRHARR